MVDSAAAAAAATASATNMSSDAPPPHPDNSGKIILLTGINGFIASHIALQLLEKGYIVRGTTRSPAAMDRLRSQPAFRPFPPSSLQHVVVTDLTAPDAFTQAVKGVHAVIHTASPLDFKLTSTDAFLGPAVGGVLSILRAAYEENRDHGGQIAAFVLTSSISAIADRWRFPSVSEGGSENHAYTEADWNQTAERVARESERTGPFLPMVAYGASKAAAERAMWDFVESHRQPDPHDPQQQQQQRRRVDGNGTKPTWPGPSCSAICPGVTTGPPINWPDTPASLSETVRPIWELWSGHSKHANGGRLPPQIGGATYIDVRDVARMHVWCVEHPRQSSGERYLLTNGKAPPQAAADVLRTVLFADDARVRDRIAVGEPGAGWVPGFGWPENETTAVARKAYDALGVQRFRSFDESLRDTVLAFREHWPELDL